MQSIAVSKLFLPGRTTVLVPITKGFYNYWLQIFNNNLCSQMDININCTYFRMLWFDTCIQHYILIISNWGFERGKNEKNEKNLKTMLKSLIKNLNRN